MYEKGWRDLNWRIEEVEPKPSRLHNFLNRAAWAAFWLILGVVGGYTWCFHHLTK